MARPRKAWKYSVGRYGNKVKIFEPELARPLRWDYRENGTRTRPEVVPAIRVRLSPDAPPDPALEQRARDLCEQKAASLTLAPLREATEPEALTLGMAYQLYFEPRRKALPKSKSGRIHVEASRAFWLAQLKPETKWDAIAPADVKAGIVTLIESGQVATAEKRLANLITLYHWLVDGMGFDHVRNPARKIDFKKLTEGYKPRRPRYTKAEVDRLISKAHTFGPRFDLFVKLMADSGARAGQVRGALRSGLNCALEPPPPAGLFPLGWLQLPKMKNQPPMLTALTRRQRDALDVALSDYLAEWEAEWLQHGTDYPLFPGGQHTYDRSSFLTDNALRHMWAKLEAKAEMPKVKRRAFHGSRRSWSDDIFEAEGLDTVTAAGGWTKTETPEGIYLDTVKYSHIERARKRRETPDE